MEYLKREQLQVAQDKIEKALEQNPKDVNVQLAAGLVYERLRENKTAEKHFRQAVRVAPVIKPGYYTVLSARGCGEEVERILRTDRRLEGCFV